MIHWKHSRFMAPSDSGASCPAPGALQLHSAALVCIPPGVYVDVQRRAEKRREDVPLESSQSPADHGDLLALAVAPSPTPVSRPKSATGVLFDLPALTRTAPTTNGNRPSGLHGLLAAVHAISSNGDYQADCCGGTYTAGWPHDCRCQVARQAAIRLRPCRRPLGCVRVVRAPQR